MDGITNLYYSDKEFYIFVSKEVIDKYAFQIKHNKEFKDALFGMAYYQYKVQNSKSSIQEGYFSGTSPDRQEAKTFQEAYSKYISEAKECLSYYSRKFNELLKEYVSNIPLINDITDKLKHSLVDSGRTNHITGPLTNISKEEALYALNIGVKIGFKDSTEDHGTWEGYYQYHPILTEEKILKSTDQISIDPVYDLANNEVGTKFIKDMLSSLVEKQVKLINNELKKMKIQPTKDLVSKIVQLYIVSPNTNSIKEVINMKTENSAENALLKEIKLAMFIQRNFQFEY